LKLGFHGITRREERRFFQSVRQRGKENKLSLRAWMIARSATSASAEAKFTVWCGGRLSVPKMRTQAGGCAITKV
jgi:hypothetical protein